MPHPNVETVRRIDQAQVAGDLETALSQYTDDVLGHVGGDNKLSGDYRGLEQLQTRSPLRSSTGGGGVAPPGRLTGDGTHTRKAPRQVEVS